MANYYGPVQVGDFSVHTTDSPTQFLWELGLQSKTTSGLQVTRTSVLFDDGANLDAKLATAIASFENQLADDGYLPT